MDARLFTPAPVFGGLSDEIVIHIFRYLRANELSRIAKVSKDAQRLSGDDALWRDLYVRDFGPLICKEDPKLQYITAYLFKLAKHEPRPDLAQIHYLRIQTFLQTRQQKPWAKYYLGSMRFQGAGIIRNAADGLNLLLESFDQGDYKAALALTKIVETAADSQFRDALVTLIGNERCKQFIPYLKFAYNRGYIQAAYAIAYLYKNGIGVKADHEEAQDWYEAALDAKMPEAVSELMDLTNIGHDITTFLEGLKIRYAQSNLILAEICYQQGLAYHEVGNYHETMDALVKAAELGHLNARKEIGIFSLQLTQGISNTQSKKNRLNAASLHFAIGLEANHVGCTQAFYDTQIRISKLGEAQMDELIISRLKSAFVAGNPLAATLINSHTFGQNAEIDIAFDPQNVWWLQLAAQSGTESAFNNLQHLIDLEIESPYLYCAMGIIHTFGIIYSDKIMPDKEKGLRYLQMAHDMNPAALGIYLDTGLQHGIVCKEIQTVMEQMIDSPGPAYVLRNT